MNRLLSGTFGVNLWMAAGAGIVSWSTGWGAPPISTFVLTVVWLVGTIPVGVAASYLPNIRRSKLIDIIHQYQVSGVVGFGAARRWPVVTPCSHTHPLDTHVPCCCCWCFPAYVAECLLQP